MRKKPASAQVRSDDVSPERSSERNRASEDAPDGKSDMARSVGTCLRSQRRLSLFKAVDRGRRRSLLERCWRAKCRSRRGKARRRLCAPASTSGVLLARLDRLSTTTDRFPRPFPSPASAQDSAVTQLKRHDELSPRSQLERRAQVARQRGWFSPSHLWQAEACCSCASRRASRSRSSTTYIES